MKSVRTVALLACAWLVSLGLAGPAQAQQIPKALLGKIVTNSKPIDIPATAKDFAKKINKQDRLQFKKGEDGRWEIHFVAFFNRPSPVEEVGVVVLDPKGEAAALAQVKTEKGQRTLASRITVDSTEAPGKKHTLQVYYPKGKKPMILAKKVVVLK
jgi:hypothetical protein